MDEGVFTGQQPEMCRWDTAEQIVKLTIWRG